MSQPLNKRYFITGTDTSIGKTCITAGLLRAFNNRGYSTIALKPIASGCTASSHGLRNQDALILQHTANIQLPYNIVNPIAFADAVAPHIAAGNTHKLLTAEIIINNCQSAFARAADIILIEGIGGWYVPLNATQTMADVVKQLDLEIILVIGIRLGCLNHAILTYEAMLNNKAKIKGWIANCIDPEMSFIDENIQTLAHRIKVPLLGKIPFGDLTEKHVDINLLLT